MGTGVTKRAIGSTRKNSAGSIFRRSRVNLIEGTNVTLTMTDDPTNDEIDVTIASTGGGGGGTFIGLTDVPASFTGSALKVARVNAGETALEFATVSGTGDVVGPASATDAVPALFDGTTGKLLKNSTPTGTGNPVLQTSPSLTTPSLNVATATSVNKVAITAPATSATLTIADGATLTASANATVSGTNTGDVANTALTTGTLAQFAATTSAQLAGVISDETGTNKLVFSDNPALVTPNLGTPSAATLTNATGLPIATGVSGLGTGVATFLGTPSSANLAAALTDETGTGAAVFGTNPTVTFKDTGLTVTDDADTSKAMVFQVSGVTTATTRTLTVPNASGTIALTSNKLSDFAATTSAELAGVISDETGSGKLVFDTSPSFTTSITTGSSTFSIANATATTLNIGGAATTFNMAGGSGAAINLGGGASAAELRFLEPSGSGTNYTALKAQAQAGNVTYTLPSADGSNGQVLSTNGSGSLSWATGGGGSGISQGMAQAIRAGMVYTGITALS